MPRAVPQPRNSSKPAAPRAGDARRAAVGASPNSPENSAALGFRRALAWAGLGALLHWLALPPVQFAWLGFLALVPWLLLVRPGRLGRGGYLALYLAGVLFWGGTMHGIGLAHWTAWFGLAALALYLGLYLPVFVGLTRVLVLRLRWPLLLAGPLVWTGLELWRGHLITGFSMALLGHTQYEQPWLLQIADLGGAYGVSFLLAFTAAALASARLDPRPLPALGRLAAAGAAVAAALAYGGWRLAEEPPEKGRVLRAALLQEVVDTEFSEEAVTAQEAFRRYTRLARRAVSDRPEVELLVWPESMYSADNGWPTWDPGAPPPADWPPEYDFAGTLANAQRHFENRSADVLLGLPVTPPMLVGCETYHYRADGRLDRYNSALLIDPQGKLAGRYDKMHPVMFGEYVPFGDVFPWVYRLTPFASGLSRGLGPSVCEAAGMRLAPSICFESTVPHLIRRHVRELERAGEEPDLLVNLTNDGWFWGTSVLDLQLACAVFRSVEMRKPMLVAANTGISAQIDGDGRILARAPRRETEILQVTAAADGRRSLYRWLGDWPAGVCAAVCAWGAAFGLWGWWRARRKPTA